MEAFSLAMLFGAIVGIVCWGMIDARRHNRERHGEDRKP
jgi:hypothetical protein